MRKLLVVSSLVALAMIPSLYAQTAGPLPCPTGFFLSDYEARSTPCSVGTNLLFSAFTFSATNGGSSRLDQLITVTPDADGMGGGFTFGGWQAGVTGISGAADYSIGYTYEVFGDPPAVSGASIGMDPVTASVIIGQTICPVTGGDCYGGVGVNSANDPDAPDADCGGLPNLVSPCWTNTTTLPDITSAISTNSISLAGNGDVGGGFDNLTVTYDVIETAPEPTAWLLSFSGLAVAGLIRRYHR